MNEDQEKMENQEVTPDTANEQAAPIVNDEDDAPKANPNYVPAVDMVEDAVEVVVEHQSNENVAHDDFDWDLDNKGVIQYDEKERAAMAETYESTLKVINDNEIINGTVASITDSDVVLNVGFKSDGLVSTSEFRDMPDMKAGDIVEVYVVTTEDAKGQLILSRKNAKLMRAWESIVRANAEDLVVTGKIISKTKGGLIVDVMGMETFLPGSQIDVKPIIDYDAYVGKTMEFKVVKVNEAIKNAVVSHKALIESDLEAQRAEIIGQMEQGQVLEGVIKNITDFGAFIDLGGVDGLLYITDISWGRINHPSEVLELNQKLNVVVLDFDDDKKRISLGLKQLQDHPWNVLPADVEQGSTVKGKIVNIEDYGAFLEITPGVEGLIHVSEVSWSNQPINSKEFFKLGAEYDAKVVTIDREDRKMSLSIRQMSDDPWLNIEEKYAVESKHTGIVKNITPYGVFVELDEFAGGMVHISDLSWIKRFNHPNQFTKTGEEMEVVVMEIDKDNRKLSLSHKHIEEDPWDTFDAIFPVGSIHEATVVKKDDKGAIVLLPYGLEAFAPSRHLTKEDGTTVNVDETLEFKILEFERKDKRIIVSHSRVVNEAKDMADATEKKERQKSRKQASDAVSRMNQNVEKSTLGDLDALSALKQQMEDKEGKK